MTFTDIIARKRDGHALSSAEIGVFATGLADDSLPAEQVAALAMAIFLRSMTDAETGTLTAAMARSGTVLDFAADDLGGPVVDKHSTGGIGDKVSLVLAPIVAACGGFVPMISGRGLGHSGGTLDKLDAIPGYASSPPLDRFRDVVRTVGCAIIGATADLAPADRRLYAIRDVTATVASIPLITASILSKKIAGGTQALVMDVKVGSGAFMPTLDMAHALARSIVGTAAAIGLPARALITDMAQALGTSVGNAVEVAEAVAYLTGGPREPRFHAVVVALAAEMLVLTGIDADPDHAARRIDAALDSGAAAERFGQMVAALGGPSDFVEHSDRHLPHAPVVTPVHPTAAGYLIEVDARALGMAVIGLGGGRTRVDDRLDLSAGFTAVAPIGAAVGPGAPLMLVHAATTDHAARAAAAVAAACRIGPAPPAPAAVIHARVGTDRPESRG